MFASHTWHLLEHVVGITVDTVIMMMITIIIIMNVVNVVRELVSSCIKGCYYSFLSDAYVESLLVLLTQHTRTH